MVKIDIRHNGIPFMTYTLYNVIICSFSVSASTVREIFLK